MALGRRAGRGGWRHFVLGVTAAIAPLATAQTVDNPQPSVMEIMDAMVVPQSDALFGVGRTAPATAAQWKALRLDAIVLIEAGRALTVAERSEGPDWDAWSRGMAAAAAQAINAIDARDVDGVLEAGGALIESCTGCHSLYLPR